MLDFLKVFKKPIKFNSDDTLLIVDMQVGFPTSNDKRTITNCRQLIIKAKKSKANIIYLTFENYGKVLDVLQKAVKSYEKKYFVTKTENNGAIEVNELIAKNKDKFGQRIFVCGVNYNFCVKETARGLAMLSYRIKVLKEACNCSMEMRTYKV